MADIYIKQREISDINLLPKSLQDNTLEPRKTTLNHIRDTSVENVNLDINQNKLSLSQKSRLHIPQAIFSSESISTNVGGRKRKSMKRTDKRKKGGVRSIKFLVPSRKKILSSAKNVAKVNYAVSQMNKNTLAKILEKAPERLMQNIAQNVFTL